MTVFVPLNGPNDKGKKPKAPSLNGWQVPNYKGINPKTYKGWFGLRCDGYLVIDCDNAAAHDFWIERTFPHATWVRKTPRGFHHVYRWHDPLGELEHLDGPHAGVLPGIDVRAGRTSQIVYSAVDGKGEQLYNTISGGPTSVIDFHPPWASDFIVRHGADSQDSEVWDEMPDGIGNNTMTALAGTMRKQGMALPTMVRCLAAINKITMTTDPMPKEMIVEIARSVSRYEVDPFLTEIEFDDEG
jgi:hypothetical protein